MVRRFVHNGRSRVYKQESTFCFSGGMRRLFHVVPLLVLVPPLIHKNPAYSSCVGKLEVCSTSSLAFKCSSGFTKFLLALKSAYVL